MNDSERQSYELILESLWKLKNLDPSQLEYGICASVSGILGGLVEKLHNPIAFRTWSFSRVDAFMCWAEYSGDGRYPVVVCGPGSAEDQYRAAIETKDGFWGNHPYGDARRRLLDHTIEWLELKMVAEEPVKSYDGPRTI